MYKGRTVPFGRTALGRVYLFLCMLMIGPLLGDSAIATFEGKIHKNTRKGRLWIKTKWSPSAIAGAVKYQIFSRNKKIKTISARRSRKATIHLHPYLVHFSISDEYRMYLHNKYKIRVLYRGGLASPFTKLTIGS